LNKLDNNTPEGFSTSILYYVSKFAAFRGGDAYEFKENLLEEAVNNQGQTFGKITTLKEKNNQRGLRGGSTKRVNYIPATFFFFLNK
jgi:hypothetical protein